MKSALFVACARQQSSLSGFRIEVYGSNVLTAWQMAGGNASGLRGRSLTPPVEVREVRQIGHILHQALYPRLERLIRIGAALSQTAVDLASNLGQHPDQMRDVVQRLTLSGSTG